MVTYKLKILNSLEIDDELRIYNSIVKFAFNRFQDSLKEKEIRKLVKEKFPQINYWLINSAIHIDSKALFKRFKNKKIIFGGKFNYRQYQKKLISKKEYRKNKLRPLILSGDKNRKGNRLIEFKFDENKCILKLNRKNHQKILLQNIRKNISQKLLKVQELACNNQIPITCKLNKEYLWVTFDESKLNLVTKFKDLNENRILGIDLNPNTIGLSILEFKKNNKFKILKKQLFDLEKLTKKSNKSSSDKSSKYLNNKRKFELIQICYRINNLIKQYKCKKIAIENLKYLHSSSKGKRFNRLCNNIWDRKLISTKLKMLSNIYGHEYKEINPAYSSYMGNILYGNETTPDMIASSIEIAKRGNINNLYNNWIFPAFTHDLLNEQWKQTLMDIESWEDAIKKIKNSKLKYRVLRNKTHAVFSNFNKKSKVKTEIFS